MHSLTIWCPANSMSLFRKLTEEIELGVEAEAFGVIPAQAANRPLPGGVLLLLGGALADRVRRTGMVKKNATVTSMRERAFSVGDEAGWTHLMVSFDPQLLEREAERKVDLLWDVQLAARMAITGSLAPSIGDYYWVEDFHELVVQAQQGELERLSFDLETIGLDPWAPGARILTVTLTPAEGLSYVYRVTEDGRLPKRVLNQLRALLCGHKSFPRRVKIQAANGKYDEVWTGQHWGIEGINFTFDTHLVGSLLDENRSNSLETHAKIYTPMGGYDVAFNRAWDKSRMDLALDGDPDGFLTYAGGDTDACHRVANVQRRLLTKDKALTRFYNRIVQPAARVFAKVERRGVLVDRERYKELEKEVTAELKVQAKEVLKHIPRRLIMKYADNLNPSRPALVKEFMFTKRGLNLKPLMLTESGEQKRKDGEDVDWLEYASTSGDHLQMFANHPVAGPFAKAMARYGATKKTLDTYIIGFQEHIRSDGMFHPTYRMGRGSSTEDTEGGTVTGRLSATDPAYQTIPKRTVWAKPLRTVYPCPPGHGIVKLDFNQGELRIVAVVANEQTMLKAYATNTDLHSLTAAGTMGLTLEQFVSLDEAVREERRRAAKAINFGLLYGMQPPSLVDYSRKNYGVDMSLEDAEANSDAFFATYPGLLTYHAEMKRQAHKYQQVRNPLGRIRHLPLINSSEFKVRNLSERQAINSPIQSCLSDLMLLAMVEIDRRWPDLWIFGMTHDSLEMYLELEHLDERVIEVREVMENLPVQQFDWHPQITFKADPEVAYEGTLADVKKWGNV